MHLTSKPALVARDRAGFLLTTRVREAEATALAATQPGELMARAATAVADKADSLLQALPNGTPAFAAIGPGNNGGDALLALMMLARRGYPVAAFADFDPAGSPMHASDAQAVHRRWRDAGGQLLPLADIVRHLPSVNVPLLLDGMFGIGLSKPLGGAAARFADLCHRSGGPVLAIDVPSGLDADRGSLVGGPLASAVSATHTVTMIADKPGLHTGQGPALAGEVTVATLGLTGFGVSGTRIDEAWARSRLAERSPASHKGSFGTALIVGGASAMRGAALLAAQGARAVGAGKIATLGADGPVFNPASPQIMAWQAERPSEFSALMARATALAVGCGLGDGAAARSLLGRALDLDRPLCLDADALNLLAAKDAPAQWRARMHARCGAAETVLTPHPLEAARLLNSEVREIEHDRSGAALEIANRFECTVLLKGAGTVMATVDGRWGIVTTGTSALATGGTGDVLAGMVAGLLAQGYRAWEAGGVAATVHGLAAQAWHQDHSRGVGLALEALLEQIVKTINEL